MQKSSKWDIVFDYTWFDRDWKAGLENNSHGLSEVCFHCKTLPEEAYEQKQNKKIFPQDSKIFTFD
jgi:hypothetical protein